MTSLIAIKSKSEKEGLNLFCYDGNDYDRSRGKGYGEAAIMEYGFSHSNMINNAVATDFIVKVT